MRFLNDKYKLISDFRKVDIFLDIIALFSHVPFIYLCRNIERSERFRFIRKIRVLKTSQFGGKSGNIFDIDDYVTRFT